MLLDGFKHLVALIEQSAVKGARLHDERLLAAKVKVLNRYYAHGGEKARGTLCASADCPRLSSAWSGDSCYSTPTWYLVCAHNACSRSRRS